MELPSFNSKNKKEKKVIYNNFIKISIITYLTEIPTRVLQIKILTHY